MSPCLTHRSGAATTLFGGRTRLSAGSFAGSFERAIIEKLRFDIYLQNAERFAETLMILRSNRDVRVDLICAALREMEAIG
jgi:DeoR/GlpR family transcriptional regulator of sugar metabolism